MKKADMQGILLIGMPYVGKSTIGRQVAKALGFDFFDGDDEIEKTLPERQKYLDKHGDDKYVQMEAEIICRLPKNNSVLAPGGSIIYSDRCRDYFKDCFRVYLNASLSTIKKRITNIDKRGIVKLKKLGLEALYRERKEMFSSFADIELESDTREAEELSKLIVNEYIIRKLSKNKPKIRFVSTNGKSKASFTEALNKGLAPDKGLFVPDKLPNFSEEEIELMRNLDYAQLAFILLRQFVDFDDDVFYRMCS